MYIITFFSFNSAVEYVTVVFAKALIPVPVIGMLFICGEIKTRKCGKIY
jgi:hypothetical protein